MIGRMNSPLNLASRNIHVMFVVKKFTLSILMFIARKYVTLASLGAPIVMIVKCTPFLTGKG